MWKRANSNTSPALLLISRFMLAWKISTIHSVSWTAETTSVLNGLLRWLSAGWSARSFAASLSWYARQASAVSKEWLPIPTVWTRSDMTRSSAPIWAAQAAMSMPSSPEASEERLPLASESARRFRPDATRRHATATRAPLASAAIAAGAAGEAVRSRGHMV